MIKIWLIWWMSGLGKFMNNHFSLPCRTPTSWLILILCWINDKRMTTGISLIWFFLLLALGLGFGVVMSLTSFSMCFKSAGSILSTPFTHDNSGQYVTQFTLHNIIPRHKGTFSCRIISQQEQIDIASVGIVQSNGSMEVLTIVSDTNNLSHEETALLFIKNHIFLK